MTIESWLQAATAAAERRGLHELKPLLETLAQATAALRQSSVARHQSPANSHQTSVESHPGDETPR